MSSEMYIYLSCTTMGEPIWRASYENDHRAVDGLPPYGVWKEPQVRRIGPWPIADSVEDEGYPSIEEGILAFCEVDLEDPRTWFDQKGWIENYLDGN